MLKLITQNNNFAEIDDQKIKNSQIRNVHNYMTKFATRDYQKFLELF